jgi:DNA-binding NtrC family response regulator
MKNFLTIDTNPSNPFELSAEYITIGSNTSCSIQLLCRSVEDRHCVIEKRHHQYYLKDMRSQSGTYLNQVKVIEAPLSHGDLISIGDCNLKFSSQQFDTSNLLASKNHSWNNQLKKIASIAKSDFPVLLTGASGSGKEVLAQQIHSKSFRSNGPFISVNCSALTESLIESELFGHTKGSYTGAIKDRKGAFEAAREGTLFLDEIGDLPLSLQAKLLRALENNEIRPVGSDETLKTDVRIIAATHHDLKRKIFDKEFRADLFFRLDVVGIRVPKLIERMEDFEEILHQLSKAANVRFHSTAVSFLKDHIWPGNIRELKNTVARASVLFPKKEIQIHHLNSLIEIIPNYCLEKDAEIKQGVMRSTRISEAERELIVHHLRLNNGNQRKTSRELGIPKSTLHDKIKSYEINIQDILMNF